MLAHARATPCAAGARSSLGGWLKSSFVRCTQLGGAPEGRRSRRGRDATTPAEGVQLRSTCRARSPAGSALSGGSVVRLVDAAANIGRDHAHRVPNRRWRPPHATTPPPNDTSQERGCTRQGRRLAGARSARSSAPRWPARRRADFRQRIKLHFPCLASEGNSPGKGAHRAALLIEQSQLVRLPHAP